MSNGIAFAFPLDWPVGWPRTPDRKRERSRYSTEFEKARKELSRELDRMYASRIVMSSNVPLRRDGFPYATAAKKNLVDPGVAVYFVWKKKQYVIACDVWDHVKDNFRACGLTIGAMRLIARAGASHLLERAFQGFKALPEPAINKTCWQILGVSQDASDEEINSAYKTLMDEFHPDHGGTNEHAQIINKARREALGK